MKANSVEELQALVDGLIESLPNVTAKKMFGCPAYWASGNVFALVWKHGRIGVRLPSEGKYDSLMDVSGSSPWKAGPMTMAHWVLVPPAYHADGAQLKKWLKEAHKLNVSLEPGKKPATKSKSKKTKA
jgi:TfoX/Sxy family transcriptional regulator of competence genes